MTVSVTPTPAGAVSVGDVLYAKLPAGFPPRTSLVLAVKHDSGDVVLTVLDGRVDQRDDECTRRTMTFPAARTVARLRLESAA